MKRRLLAVSAVCGVLVVALVGWVHVASATSAAVSQSYAAGSDVVAGMAVAIDPSSHRAVPANIQNVDRLLGIATANGGALLEARNSTTGVQVVTAGTASVLVSDLNGTVKAGDRLGVSQLNGIAQRVSTSDPSFGLAQSDLSAGSPIHETVKLSNGQSKTVVVGQVAVVVSLPVNDQKQQSTSQSGWVQRLADSLAGRSVSLQRVMIAGLISLTSLACVFVLLYSSTHASIMSIGRNPLAHKSIRSSLAQVMVLALVIIVVAQIVAVAILRL